MIRDDVAGRAAGEAVPDARTADARTDDALIRGVRRVGALTRGAAGGGTADDVVDVRITAGQVSAIGPGLTHRGEPVHDGGGRWIMPGLWDQHVHLGQWVLSSLRLDTSGARDAAHACALVAAALADLPPGATLQGWGHRSGAWPAAPSTAQLDAVSGGHAVVLISGDAHHGWLNSRALELLGLPHRPGVIAEAEWFGLFPRLLELPGVAAQLEARYADVVAAAHARGIAGVGDMEFCNGPEQWRRRFGGAEGARPVDTLRVRAAVYEPDLEWALGEGLRSGQALPDCGGLIEMGPLKIISDGSLNTRTAYCCDPYADAPGDGAEVAHADPGTTPAAYGVQNVPLPRLTELLRRARAGGLRAAVHAIGDRAVTEALDAFEATGIGGTVEHAQLVRWADLPRMARLGVLASVQPAHLLDDRDLTEQCWPDRTQRCFPFRAMADVGVRLGLGSDAPVSPLDPWLAAAAAVHRSADARAPWHPEQSLRVAEALAASTDGVRLEVGQRGDVILLDRDPLAVPDESREASAALREMPVAATFVAGRCVHAS